MTINMVMLTFIMISLGSCASGEIGELSDSSVDETYSLNKSESITNISPTTFTNTTAESDDIQQDIDKTISTEITSNTNVSNDKYIRLEIYKNESGEPPFLGTKSAFEIIDLFLNGYDDKQDIKSMNEILSTLLDKNILCYHTYLRANYGYGELTNDLDSIYADVEFIEDEVEDYKVKLNHKIFGKSLAKINSFKLLPF